jgi:hypothetical protein
MSKPDMDNENCDFKDESGALSAMFLASTVLYGLGFLTLSCYACYRHVISSSICSLDWRSLIFIVLYMVILLSKFLATSSYLIFKEQKARIYLECAYMFLDICVWLITYSFLFDMQEVADIFFCGAPLEYEKRARRTRITRWLFLVGSTLFTMTYHIIEGLKLFKVGKEYSDILLIINGATRLLYGFCFIYISVKWLLLIDFFI